MLLVASKPVIVVHGGAGRWDPQHSGPALEGVKKAAELGFDLLMAGGTALDAVVEAVAFMEDTGIFNAGRGSALNIDGHVEMEASVMNGKTLEAGAVALLKDVRNPVRLARLVMENTDHVFIVGKGAEKLARIFNVERICATPSNFQLERYRMQRQALLDGKFNLQKLANLVRAHPELFSMETVGAVALDKHGDVAAATSTGGFPLKFPGRMGDSPLIGCGTYADNQSGACSATGIGEIAIRLVLAKTVCNYMAFGKTAQEAVEEAVNLVNQRFHLIPNSIGLIAVSAKGEVGAAHNSDNLCWAYMAPDAQRPLAYLKAKFLK
jgi:beta-aspartyl-peptidase (threonine type)